MKKQDYSRRDFLRTLGLTSILLSKFGILTCQKKKPRKPNVVIFFTDDQGTIDVNCFGADDLHTPHLDQLARQGTRFTQFYVGAPVCSPSRAALLTGRYPARAQLTTNAGGNRGLPGHQFTMAELFRQAGYRTAIFGKWHLGEAPDQSPISQGFDEFLGHKRGCIDNYSHFFYWSGPNRHDLWKNEEKYWEDGSYFPDMVVREASRFMEENSDHPFFLYLPFNVPHYPLQGTEHNRERYRDLESPRDMYAALVTTLDEKIGQVIRKINRLGLREDTIIVFLSDHGHSVEVRAFRGGGSSGDFRGHKFTLWEGGIRVPFIISWVGHIPENEVRDQMAISIDVMPTMAAFCQIDLPDRKIDGKDVGPLIRSSSVESPHSVLYWQHGDQWAVREGPWKLVNNGSATLYKGQEIQKVQTFLANFDQDKTETQNFAEQHPEMIQRLTALHDEWIKEVEKQ